MFSKYVFIFALVALFSVQKVSALTPEQYDEKALADIIEKAKQAFEKLKQIITDAIGSALSKLAEIKDAIVSTASKIIEKATAEIKAAIQKVKDEIEKIKEQAAAVGVDIKECLVENQAALEQLPWTIINKLKECVANEVDKIGAIINQAIDDVISIKDKILDFPAKLKDCITSVSISCVKDLIADIVSDISVLPGKITSIVGQVIQVAANIEGNLKTCAINKILEATKEAAAIGAAVAKCVADKIRE